MNGTLVLIGGGIPGKATMALLKSKGAVVLDIGSVFDMWAGWATRGKGKGVGAVNPKYKLGA